MSRKLCPGYETLNRSNIAHIADVTEAQLPFGGTFYNFSVEALSQFRYKCSTLQNESGKWFILKSLQRNIVSIKMSLNICSKQ